MADANPHRAYALYMPPETVAPLVFASPHSGRAYPDALVDRSILTLEQLRSSEDAYIDRLFAAAPRNGAPLLAAQLPRAWIDVNRAADELDPALIEGQRRGGQSPRVASGLGVVPRVVSGGRAIYRGKLTPEEAEGRIRDVWHPYHATLSRLMDAAVLRFGRAILVDCHSMPHEALEAVSVGGRRPDLVLGDRYGASARSDIVDAIEAEFVREGFTVSRNAPFAGAYIAQHYGRPARDRHAVQVEIDRRLYMDEATVTPHGGFRDLQVRLDGVVTRLCRYGRSLAGPLAAE
jgi:N-formylglutamate amidohydrolase